MRVVSIQEATAYVQYRIQGYVKHYHEGASWHSETPHFEHVLRVAASLYKLDFKTCPSSAYLWPSRQRLPHPSSVNQHWLESSGSSDTALQTIQHTFMSEANNQHPIDLFFGGRCWKWIKLTA